MSQITNWIELQQRIKSADDTHAVEIVLEGPDQTKWGRWPINLDNLPATVEAAAKSLEADLASGRHTAKLQALDASGNQVSMHPVTLHGKSQQASAAATDAIAMQRAVATLTSNTEAMLNLSRNMCERQDKAIESLQEDRACLIEKLTEISALNLEAELRIKESERRRETMAQIGLAIATAAGPALAPLIGKLAEALDVKLDGWIEAARSKKLPPKSAEQTPAGPPEASAPAAPSVPSGESAPKPGNPAGDLSQTDKSDSVTSNVPGAHPKPCYGATGDSPQPARPVETDGAGRTAGGGRDDSRKPRAVTAKGRLRPRKRPS